MVQADLALVDGNIVTFDSSNPIAQAVAVKNDRFLAVGSNEEVQYCIGRDTKKISLESKTVVPGFIDTHIHAAALGFANMNVDLRGVKSIKALQLGVAQMATNKRRHEWVTGRGWDQDKLTERRYPSCADLDKAVSDQPVFLLRVCGHVGVANSKALKIAGITGQTKAPAGGSIDLMEKTGEPSGILRETALNLIYDVLPRPNQSDLTVACQSACQQMLEVGITSAHWIIRSPIELRALQELKKRNLLPIRVYAVLPVEYLDFLTSLGLETGFGDDRIKIGCIKIMVDGSLGARTAALKHSYSDAKGNTGTLLYSEERLRVLIRSVHEARLQLAIHAIGDRAIDLVVGILENEF
jgi:predicted amidohydrolase YtcJ